VENYDFKAAREMKREEEGEGWEVEDGDMQEEEMAVENKESVKHR